MLRTIAFIALGIVSSISLMFGAFIMSGLDAIPVTTPLGLWPLPVWASLGFITVGFLGLTAMLISTQD